MKKISRVRSYHHGDLKTALVDAVLKLVREKGLRGFSLNEAARMAGGSVAAPYRHFRDKGALLAEVVRQGNKSLELELRKAADRSEAVQDRLMDICMAYVRFAKQHPDYFAVMFGSGIDKSQFPEIQRSAAKAFGVVLDLVRGTNSSLKGAQEHAITYWVFVHGLVTLGSEGALSNITGEPFGDKMYESILRRFIQQE